MISISTSGKTKMPVLCDWEIRLNRITKFPDTVSGKLVSNYKKETAGSWVGYGGVEQVLFVGADSPPNVKLDSGLNVKLLGRGLIGYLVSGDDLAKIEALNMDDDDDN